MVSTSVKEDGHGLLLGQRGVVMLKFVYFCSLQNCGNLSGKSGSWIVILMSELLLFLFFSTFKYPKI